MKILILLFFVGYISAGEPISSQFIEATLSKLDRSLEEAERIVSEQNLSSFDFGILLCEERPEDALKWFTLLANKHNSKSEYLFGIAWVYWIKNDILRAQKETLYALSKGEEEPLIQGRCHYLLGLINIDLWKIDVAEKELKKSIDIFDNLNLKGAKFKSILSLVDICYLDNRLNLAKEILREAEVVNAARKDPTMGVSDILFRKGSINFKAGNYKESRKFFLEGLNSASKDNQLFIQVVNTNIAILDVLNGDLNGAMERARSVEHFITKAGMTDKQLYYYNNIAWVYIYKCQGVDAIWMEASINEWCKKNAQNRELIQLLQFVKSAPCNKLTQ